MQLHPLLDSTLTSNNCLSVCPSSARHKDRITLSAGTDFSVMQMSKNIKDTHINILKKNRLEYG